MKTILKPLLAAGLMLSAAPLATAPAAAQAVKGIGVVDYNAVIASSSAYKTAETQRPVTYKAQLDQAEARKKAIEAQLKPLVDKFQADRKAAAPNQAALQTQYEQIQRIEESGRQEIQKILMPYGLSQAYVGEQISDKIDQAVKQAMTKQKIGIVLRSPDAVIAADNAYYLNDAVRAELDALLPSAQLVPPNGWVPREYREQMEQAAAQQGGGTAPAQPAAPAGPQPTGR